MIRYLSFLSRVSLPKTVYVSSLISFAVLLCIAFAPSYLSIPKARSPLIDDTRVAQGFTAGDSSAYLSIAQHGYHGHRRAASLNVFFPFYPACIFLLSSITSWPLVYSGAALSFIACLGATLLFHQYATERYETKSADWGLILLSVFPATLFFRAAYTESLFILMEILFLFGLLRGVSFRWLSLLAAIASVTRPVGIALTCVLVFHQLRASAGRRAWLHALETLLATGAFLGAFAYFQMVGGNSPTAFVSEQSSWSARWNGWTQWLVFSACLEPLTCAWRQGAIGYWGTYSPDIGLINYVFWNPLLWIALVWLGVYGWLKRWLTLEESLLTLLIIAIPYGLQAYRTGFSSQARYAAIAVPCFLVAGRIMAHWPVEARVAIVVPSFALLLIFACQFAAGYLVI